MRKKLVAAGLGAKSLENGAMINWRE